MLLLAACGGSSSNGEASKTAAQVVKDAVAAASAASAVHVSGKITSSGTPLQLDLHLAGSKDAKGSISENGLRFDLVRVGDSAYIRGSDAFYRKLGGGGAVALLHGRWIKASATSGQFGQLGQLTDLKALFAAVSGGKRTLVNKGETTYAGKKAIEIDDTSHDGKLYVAATGKPYPLALVGGGANSGTISFDGWNESVSIAAPAKALDLSALGG